MCFVIITQHNWLFLGEKFLLFKPHFAQLQAMKTSETYKAYTPPMRKPKNEQEISGMCTYFRVVMET